MPATYNSAKNTAHADAGFKRPRAIVSIDLSTGELNSEDRSMDKMAEGSIKADSEVKQLPLSQSEIISRVYRYANDPVK